MALNIGKLGNHGYSTIMKYIFVTGQPGVGKTTLCISVAQKLAKELKHARISGFYTEERRVDGERVGFDVVSLSDGTRRALASIGRHTNGPVVGKYCVDVDAFEAVALPTLRPDPSIRVYIIDEVGKMELFSARFQEAAEALVQQCGGPGVILGTIPQPRAPIGFVEKIRAAANVQVVTLTKANRDAETIRIYQCLRDYVLGST